MEIPYEVLLIKDQNQEISQRLINWRYEKNLYSKNGLVDAVSMSALGLNIPVQKHLPR
jgi:hypothetical protein